MLQVTVKRHRTDHTPSGDPVYEVILQDPAPVAGRPLNLLFAATYPGLEALHRALDPIVRGVTDQVVAKEIEGKRPPLQREGKA